MKKREKVWFLAGERGFPAIPAAKKQQAATGEQATGSLGNQELIAGGPHDEAPKAAALSPGEVGGGKDAKPDVGGCVEGEGTSRVIDEILAVDLDIGSSQAAFACAQVGVDPEVIEVGVSVLCKLDHQGIRPGCERRRS